MTQTPALRYGYNKGLPPGVGSAWGCRAVVNPDGSVSLVGDRQDARHRPARR